MNTVSFTKSLQNLELLHMRYLSKERNVEMWKRNLKYVQCDKVPGNSLILY